MLSVVISQNNWKLSHRDSSDMLNATNCKLTYQTKRLNQSIWFISVNEWLVVAYSITDNFKLSNCIVIIAPILSCPTKGTVPNKPEYSSYPFFGLTHCQGIVQLCHQFQNLILKNFWLFAQDCHNIVGTALRATMSPVALRGRMEKSLIEGGEQTLPPEWPLLHQWEFPAHQSCAKPPCLKCDNLARSPLV